MLESVSRVMLPPHRLVPAMFRSAPLLPTPGPLRMSGSRTLPVMLLTWSWALVATVVPAVVVPSALTLLMASTPALTVICPVKALLSLLRPRVPAPSLVSWTPLPLRCPDSVAVAPRFTVKNCWLLLVPLRRTSSEIVLLMRPEPMISDEPVPLVVELPRPTWLPCKV